MKIMPSACKISLEKKRYFSNLCVRCKGVKRLCGLEFCPLMKKVIAQIKIKPKILKLKEEVFAPSPRSIFVGDRGYPYVFAGPLLSLVEDKEILEKIDDVKKWYGLELEKILELRFLTLRASKREYVFKKESFKEKLKEISLAENFLDLEIKFRKRPVFRFNINPISQPTGGFGILERINIANNPKIPKNVEKIVEDELTAKEQIFLLYEKAKKDVWEITKIFSSGSLGKVERKKLVPTRWSITAIDDLISKELIKRIKEYPKISEYLVFNNEFLYNHFEILFLPSSFSFEMIEAWFPKTIWNFEGKEIIQNDYEFHFGRKGYAERIGGAYYASRLAISEYLNNIKRQSSVLIIREILPEYAIPLGVWEVRENIRNALEKKPKKFDSLKKALEDISRRLKINFEKYRKISVLLKQKNLFNV